MSTFTREGFKWRETYFVLFESKKRPTLKKIERALAKVNSRFKLAAEQADPEGYFESVTLISPEDNAAIDISYESGDEVLEQGAALQKELRGNLCDDDDMRRLERLPNLDARFDVLHFEQTTGGDSDELLDPGALLIVLEQLVDLTKGVGVDPQSGTLV